MIDTDKYKGHTKGPWAWAEYPPSDSTLKWCLTRRREGTTGIYLPETFCYLMSFQNPNKSSQPENYKLIADAPLLLAFYKRIKEIMDMDEIQEIERVELIQQFLIAIRYHYIQELKLLAEE